MLKYLIILQFSLLHTYGQEFFAVGKKLSDFKEKVTIDSIAIKVTGLPSKIDTSYGLSKICFNIEHSSTSDLKIELVSPNGTSIWLSNRNGKENAANYLNTCFSSTGFNGYIHQGKAPFIGEYIPDGRLSFINNGQNPNGTWYIFIQDLKKGTSGVCNYIKLDFGKNPMPNNDIGVCSTEYPELCKCANSKLDCDLLPDLVVLPKFTKDQLEEFSQNDPNYPGQLRMAASIANIGDGPMEVLGKGEWVNLNGEKVDSNYVDKAGNNARQLIYQRIHKKNTVNSIIKIDKKAGTNYFDRKPGHNHFHVDDWVVFRLLKREKGESGKIKNTLIATGKKVSYCLWDTGICNNSDSLCFVNNKFYGSKNLPNYGLGNFTGCDSNVQGISVGGYDTYGMFYEGQYLNIPKGTKNGKYILEIEVDPLKKYAEKDKSNNIFSMEIELKKQAMN